jgi:hypothetical protein
VAIVQVYADPLLRADDMLLHPRHAVAFIERDLPDDAALAEGLGFSALNTRGLRRSI